MNGDIMQIIFCVAMLLFLVVATAIVLTDIKHSDEMDYDRRDAVLLAFTNGHIEGGIEGGGE